MKSCNNSFIAKIVTLWVQNVPENVVYLIFWVIPWCKIQSQPNKEDHDKGQLNSV